LDGIIFKCLEKDPEKRYQSAKNLADDLAKVRNDAARASHARETASEPAKPVLEAQADEGIKAVVQSPGRSHRTLVLTGILILVSLIVAGGILLSLEEFAHRPANHRGKHDSTKLSGGSAFR